MKVKNANKRIKTNIFIIEIIINVTLHLLNLGTQIGFANSKHQNEEVQEKHLKNYISKLKRNDDSPEMNFINFYEYYSQCVLFPESIII